MKNILKKIGLIAIIVGVLSPFITLPNVNASTEECRYYLNQYLFLDVFGGAEIEVYENNDDMIGKRNFTSYIYTFEKPLAGERLEIINHGNVNLSRQEQLDEYFDAYQIFYENSTIKERRDIAKFGTWAQTADSYENVTTLVHGKWANDEDREAVTSTWPKFDDFDDFESQTIHNAIGDIVNLQVSLGGASLDNGYFGLASGEYKRDIEAFMNQVISDYNSGVTNTTSYEDYYLTTENDQVYFNVNILREIDTEDLEEVTFGYTDDSGDNWVFSTQEGVGKSTNSYEAFIVNSGKNKTKCTAENNCYLNKGSYDYDVDQTYYWPSLYNIEYKVCKQVSNSSSWTLTYDRGVSSEEVVNVTNMPTVNPVTGITTSKYTLSSTKPERKDYEFKSWCTEKDGKGTCVEAGKEFVNEKMEDDILYAYWVKPGTENNEKQGVISYVIGFIGVGLIAYGLYYVINKKDLFKQI